VLRAVGCGVQLWALMPSAVRWMGDGHAPALQKLEAGGSSAPRCRPGGQLRCCSGGHPSGGLRGGARLIKAGRVEAEQVRHARCRMTAMGIAPPWRHHPPAHLLAKALGGHEAEQDLLQLRLRSGPDKGLGFKVRVSVRVRLRVGGHEAEQDLLQLRRRRKDSASSHRSCL